MFSSRKLERATYDSVAFRYIAANDHPDRDRIATFRRRFLKEIEGLFVRVLQRRPPRDHAGKLEAQLKAEVADLLARAGGGR
jgi:hypothetical protein